MKAIITLFFVITLISGSVYCDMYLKHEYFSIFQRSGSLIVIIGAFWESKYLLKLGIDNVLHTNGEITVDETKYINNNKNGLFSLKSLQDHVGFYLIILGTFIWGYGDILGKFT